MLIELTHVKKRFGNQAMLTDGTLQLAAGQILGLIGPSGAGLWHSAVNGGALRISDDAVYPDHRDSPTVFRWYCAAGFTGGLG